MMFNPHRLPIYLDVSDGGKLHQAVIIIHHGAE
jgi:hypothetical protein